MMKDKPSKSIHLQNDAKQALKANDIEINGKPEGRIIFGMYGIMCLATHDPLLFQV